MRPTRLLPGFSPVLSALSLLGLVALFVQSGCWSDGRSSSFYTYCDNTGCYQCDQNGCSRSQGLPTGATCSSNTDCAAGCYCASNGQCAEGGFCDIPTDCATGYVCDVPRHSCEPGSGDGGVTGGGGDGGVTGGDGGVTGGGGDGGTGLPPQACTVAADCIAGWECNNGLCQVAPIWPDHCVFDRQCGTGGVCEDGDCQLACTSDATCGTGTSCTGGRCLPSTGANPCVTDAQCGAAQSCINSVCHLSCTKNSECQANNANDLCLLGTCRPNQQRVPECKINADCSGGLQCVDAECRAFCFASLDCALCANGDNVCSSGGFCMTAHEISPSCQLARDCSGGAQHCLDGACN